MNAYKLCGIVEPLDLIVFMVDEVKPKNQLQHFSYTRRLGLTSIILHSKCLVILDGVPLRLLNARQHKSSAVITLLLLGISGSSQYSWLSHDFPFYWLITVKWFDSARTVAHKSYKM
jgi:hypothetical protein